MKNVKSAHFRQIDHQIKAINQRNGTIILPSPEAYDKFPWTRRHFAKKPAEGYFVWVKKETGVPLTTCVTIASPKIQQNLINLLVVEKNVKVKANVVCNAAKNNLYGIHQAKGKLILKEGAVLIYNQFHQWGKNDFVNPNYEFILGKNSQLTYTYKNLLPPKELKLKTIIHAKKGASCQLTTTINGIKTKISVEEGIFLEGKDSRGILQLRLVGRKESQTKAASKIVAQKAGFGHLDCQGLLIDKKAVIDLIPRLICQNPKAQLTHEASIGKISDQQLNYLRSRGLSEKEAINLIVSGFLEI